MEGEADQIGRDLAAKPARLRKLRGIDICGVEEAQPLWVSAETLRQVRARSSEIAGRTAVAWSSTSAPHGPRWRGLRVALTSGMRAVAEPFHWKLIERGDRIGHGIALTLDPREMVGAKQR